MSDFQLGQRVKYAHTIHRRLKVWGKDKAQFDKFWTTETYMGGRTEGGEGVIVGWRTLSNGDTDHYGYDGGTVYVGGEYFKAWLVAFDLRRKPVHVLPEHIEAAS